MVQDILVSSAEIETFINNDLANISYLTLHDVSHKLPSPINLPPQSTNDFEIQEN